MKKIFTFVLLCIAIIPVNAQEPSMEFEFTTVDIGGFPHEKHVLAVWVETAQEEFVKTQLVYADVRKVDLYTWNAAPAYGNGVDAITGATQEYHKTYTVPWNCLDLEGNVIPIGDYVLHLEMNNNHYQGPLAEIEFTIDGNYFVLTPNDEEFFKDITLTYNAGDINVNPTIRKDLVADVSPNPANKNIQVYFGNLSSKNELTIYSATGQIVKHIKTENTEIKLELNNLEHGIYFCKIKSGNQTITKKLIIK